MERFYRVEKGSSKGKLFKKLKWLRGDDPSADLVEYRLIEVERIPIPEYKRNFVKRNMIKG